MKKTIALLVLLISLAAAVSAQAASGGFILNGYEAYRKGDWTTALLVFKRAVVTREYATEENYFMLVMSEIFARSYDDAVNDASRFVMLFPSSRYISYIMYQRGRALLFSGRTAEALTELTAFCHRWPQHEFYSSALYWVAECFYADYNFDAARALYQRIISDFPFDTKAADSRHRIEAISQRVREEKLLYLLKVTGEEYLAAKEEYEKQLSQNRVEGMVDLQRRMRILNSESEALKKELEDARKIYDEEISFLIEPSPVLQYEESSPPDSRSQVSNSVTILDPAALSSEYKANRAKSDLQYRGKPVRVTGKIFYIGELHDNEYYVNLYDGEYDIDVYIRMSEADKLIKFSTGDTITVLGTYQGSLDIADAVILE